MGYIRHHAIIVTGTYEDWIQKAHKRATAIFTNVSDIVDGEINNTRSFFIPPDGSKEGWSESEEGDARRDKFIEWLNKQRYEDGSSPLAWVEMQYGDDEGITKRLRHSDEIVEKEKGKP